MHTEIEARLLEVDVDGFRRKLERNGAEFVGDWVQMRYCYDFNPVEENRWIRLRTNGKSTTLTIKDISDKSITDTNEILNQLGYKARSKQENRRIQYKLDGVEIDIDMWPLIPPYVEFEGPSEDAIYDVCDKLGIDKENLTSLDVTSIYEKYGYDIMSKADLVLEESKKR